MMKKFCILLLLCALVLVCTLPSAAVNEDVEAYAEDVQGALFSLLDDDTLEILSALGLDELTRADTFDLSLSGLLSPFKTTVAEALQSSLKSFFLVFSLLVLLSCVGALLGERQNKPLTLAFLCAVVLQTVVLLQPAMQATASLLQASCTFMKGFLPIYAGLLAFAGNPAAALSYQSVLFAFCEGVSALSQTLCVNVVGGFLCLCVAFSMSDHVRMQSFVGGVSKAVTWVLALLSTAFAGLLSVKGVLSAATDSAAGKSVRFLLGSLIPVVGSAMSDAYSSILASIHLIKGSVAVVGMVTLLALHVPVLVQTLFSNAALRLLVTVSDVLGQTQVSAVLQGFAAALKFLLMLAALELFLLLIAVGLMLQVKGGGA